MPSNADQVFAEMELKIAQVAQRLPWQLGAELLRYTEQRFREQNWDGAPWRRRKPGTKNDNGRGLLTRTGRLRRSFRMKVSDTTLSITTNVPYAQIHNDGFDGAENIKSHTRNIKFRAKYTDLTTPVEGKSKFKTRTAKGVYQTKVKAFVRRMRMPRRRYLGDSPWLRQGLIRIATAEFKKALQ